MINEQKETNYITIGELKEIFKKEASNITNIIMHKAVEDENELSSKTLKNIEKETEDFYVQLFLLLSFLSNAFVEELNIFIKEVKEANYFSEQKISEINEIIKLYLDNLAMLPISTLDKKIRFGG